MKLDVKKILELRDKVNKNEADVSELKEALGGEKLYEFFEDYSVDFLINNVRKEGKFHKLIKDGDGFEILEGLLNKEIKGNMTDFYCIKPDYILNLSKEQQSNIANSISGGNRELSSSLQNLWRRGIKTKACTTKLKDNDPMIMMNIGIDDEKSQDFLQKVYNQEDIYADTSYTCFNGGKTIKISLLGDNLYKYLSNSKEIDLSKEKKNVFLQAIKDGLENDLELRDYYLKNQDNKGMQELSEGISNAKKHIERLEQKENKNKQINSKKTEISDSEHIAFINELKDKSFSKEEVIKRDADRMQENQQMNKTLNRSYEKDYNVPENNMIR